MRNRLLTIVSLLTLLTAASTFAENWPHWRGPSHDGVSVETSLPVSWGAKCVTGVGDLRTPSLPVTAFAPQRGGGRGFGGFGGFGGREGRPMTRLDCVRFEEENVAWKLPLPAYSGSRPIVWGDIIFLNVATAANTGALELWAIDRKTQSVAWKRPLADTNHMERKQNMSTPSPVTDGRHVWVMTGVGALKAFDFAGKEI